MPATLHILAIDASLMKAIIFIVVGIIWGIAKLVTWIQKLTTPTPALRPRATVKSAVPPRPPVGRAPNISWPIPPQIPASQQANSFARQPTATPFAKGGSVRATDTLVMRPSGIAAAAPPPVPRLPVAAPFSARPVPPPLPKRNVPQPPPNVTRAAGTDLSTPSADSVRPASGNSPAYSSAIKRWLQPDKLRRQFILTEIFQPPLALREAPQPQSAHEPSHDSPAI